MAASLMLPVSPASADTVTALAVSVVSQVVPDQPHHHLYLLTNQNTIDVRSDLGAEIKALPIPNERNIGLRGDGSQLLAMTSDTLIAYDTTSLAQTASYPLGCASSVSRMDVAGAKVWFVCGNDLDVVDLGATPPTVASVFTFPTTQTRDLVLVNPTNPTQVMVSWVVTGARVLTLVDTSASPPVQSASTTTAAANSHFAFSADGAALIGARYGTSSDGAHPRWSTTDLSALSAYGTGVLGADAITVSPTGYFAGGYASSSTTTDVWVYDSTGNILRTYDFGTPAQGGRLLAGALALAPDASRLYAATCDMYGHCSIRVLSAPTKRVSTLTLTAPSGAAIGVAYAVKGRLTSSGPALSGKTLTVQRASSYGTVTKPSVNTASDGTFTINDKVSARGWYTYTVAWAGDAGHTPVTLSVKAYVKGRATTVSVAVSTAHVTYGGAYVTVTAHLSTATQSRSLSIYATPVGLSATRLRTATVSTSGNISGSWRPSQNTYYSARFLGDAVYEPATASRLVTVSPQLSYKVSYSYGKSGSTYLFHSTSGPVIVVTLHPIRGGCMAATQQQWVSGAWKTVDVNSCLNITSVNLSTGSCGIHMNDDPRSGLFRVRITFPATKYFASAALPWVTYKYTS